MDQSVYLRGLTKKGREIRALTVRVVRKWTLRENAGEGDPLYVGMVFADAQGEAMYAEIPKEVIPKKEYLLDLGKVYIIKKYKITNAKTSYKVVEKQFMIELSEYTTIELARNPPQTIPEYIYRLTPFSSIVPAEKIVAKYTDVIGYLVKYTALNTFVPKNKEKVKMLRELYIKDLGDKELKITVWGDHAANFAIDHIYDEKAGNIIVCLLVGCIPYKDYKDQRNIFLSSGAAFSCYLNPQITEAQPYYTRFKDTPIFIERPIPAEEPVPGQVQDSPLEQKTVADLNAIQDPFEFKNGTYKCAVTITSILDNTPWWYVSCPPCKKKAVQQPDYTYKCPKCQGSETVPRYLLYFNAADDTAEALFFAYDDEASVIIGKDCKSVMNPLRLAQGLPQPLLNIINKRYVFTVDLEDKIRRQYVVKAVLEKPPKHAPHINMLPATKDAETSVEQILHPALPGTSGELIQSPKPQDEILVIESATQSTPVPSLEGADFSFKDSSARSPTHKRDTRRNLFDKTESTNKEIVHDDNLPQKDSLLDNDDLLLQTLSQSKSKRFRSESGRHSGKDGARKS